jgi:MFS family permease
MRRRRPDWLTPGVGGIGTASLLADVGHEIPTALLPGVLTSTLGAPASALGLIEGIADGVAGGARIYGGALADDPGRRRAVALGGYTGTAVLSGLIGVAQAPWQVGVLRTGAWGLRGLRVPARNALLADMVPASVYGRAYGFERAMDNLGAIVGPLLAIALVGLVGARSAILASTVFGLAAAGAILFAIRRAPGAGRRRGSRVRLRWREALSGPLRPVMAGIAAFEVGNVAATLLILRATELLSPGRSATRATQLALALYLVYNAVAAVGSVPAGRHGDRRGATRTLVLGSAAFAAAYAGLAAGADGVVGLLPWFVLAGVGIAAVETAETAAVAALAPERVRGSAFGVLAGVQSLGNFAASGVAGLLWTAIGPGVAFGYLTAWMLVAGAVFLTTARRRPAALGASSG